MTAPALPLTFPRTKSKNLMPRPTRALLALALALSAQASLAQPAPPIKVQLPKGAPPKPPREPLPTVTPEDSAKGPDRKKLQQRGSFKLDFDKVDIDKLVQVISDLTGRLFILPENIRGKITIIGPEHGTVGVTADEAYAAFLSALDSNGLTLYPVGRFLKIVEKRSGKQSNIPTLLEEDAPFTTNEQMITKLFKLHFVDAEPVRAVIQQLVSRDGDTIAFPPDTIIVNDIGLNLHRLERIIERLDSPTSSDEIRVIQIQYASATDIAEKLRQIFEEKNKKPGARPGQAVIAPTPGVPGQAQAAPAAGAPSEEGAASLSQLIADERTNKIIVTANEKAFRRIQELLRQLDTPIPGEGQVHVYYLENASAEEMANTLASLTQGINKGPRPPGGQPAGAAKGPATVADLFSGEVKITADKGTNSLVVIANNSDYRNLISVIEKLDIARRQVFVEAVIMEVNLKNQVDWGLAMHAGKPVSVKSSDDSVAVVGSELGKSNSLSGILSLASLGGFLAGLQGVQLLDKLGLPPFSVVMHALQSNSDVNVLSTPHILASDNEDAEITVGNNVPFQAGITSPAASSLGALAGTSAATAGLASGLLGGFNGLIAPIQRQNVELRLKLKPQINESDYIKLTIDEQTEEISDNDARLGPTTAKRTAKTTIVAKDQQTVVIGGLIQERTTKSVQKVPLLGDIPILGWLFRDNSALKQRTNLLLFLTPYIIRDQSDFRRIFERKIRERQEFVEQFLGRQPGYEVPVDYAKKAGPVASMFRAMDAEANKLENGGAGSPREKAILPKTNPKAFVPAPAPSPSKGSNGFLESPPSVPAQPESAPAEPPPSAEKPSGGQQ